MIRVDEGKQTGVLYHYTSVNGLLGILEDNAVAASTGNDGKFVSFTRDKDFEKRTGRNIGSMEVRMVFDGDKMSQRYRIRPYNYFHYDPEYSETGIGYMDLEAEERLKGELGDVNKYLMRVEIRREYYPLSMFRDNMSRVENILDYLLTISTKEEQLQIKIDRNQKHRVNMNLVAQYIRDTYSIECIVKGGSK